jgi:DNA-binding MarR family transcriptional regulator
MDKKDLFHKFVTFTTSVHRVKHELTKDAKSDILTPVQYSILEYIAVSQPVTLSQIRDCQNMSMPNASREVKKLSEKNLIIRMENNEDRRKQYICLSKDGENIINVAFQCIEAQFLNRIQDASTEELKDIDRALDILHTKLFY